MGDEHDGLVEVASERADHVHHVGFGFGVEVAGRFVGEYDLRSGCERSRDADTLLLSARHLRRVVVHAFAEPYSFQHFLGDCLTLVFRHALEHQRHCHVFHGSQIGKQVV